LGSPQRPSSFVQDYTDPSFANVTIFSVVFARPEPLVDYFSVHSLLFLVSDLFNQFILMLCELYTNLYELTFTIFPKSI
jgi:hypothetical protein